MFRKICLSTFGILALIAVIYPFFQKEKQDQPPQEIRVISPHDFVPLTTNDDHEEEDQEDDSELDYE